MSSGDIESVQTTTMDEQQFSIWKGHMNDLAEAILVSIASSYQDVLEVGWNQGDMVKKFQRSVNNKPDGEAWCLDFVIYCLDRTIDIISIMTNVHPSYLPRTTIEEDIPRTENVMHALKIYMDHGFITTRFPEPGQLAVWHRGKSKTAGHIGIVTGVDRQNNTFETIEGNTFNKGKTKQGVFFHKHNNSDPMLIGFITPFTMQYAKKS